MPEEVQMPTQAVLVEQFVEIIDKIELAATGHQESIDFVLWFAKETVMASAAMLDDMELQALVRKHLEATTDFVFVDESNPEG